MRKVYHLGVNTASEVVEMLLRERFRFEVWTIEGYPRRYIRVFSERAIDRVNALLEVL